MHCCTPSRLVSPGLAALTVALAFLLAVPAARAQVVWSGFAGDAQHTALSTVASQPIETILWHTPVDLAPQFSGNDLLIHYGSPVVTAADTVIVPVKTGATDGFEVEALNGDTGALKWTQTSQYSLPPHGWTPSYQPVITPQGRLYMADSGGTICYRDNLDANGNAPMHRIAFYGNAVYNANRPAYNSTVMVDTPITSDAHGNLYFGFTVTGSNPAGLTSGFARIDATGTATYVSAGTVTGGGAGQVVQNCAPALSADGHTVYVAMNSGGFSGGYLVALDSTTLATEAAVRLKDPLTLADAILPDDGTASPTVGPDGHVYFGVLENPLHSSKGWMLQFNAGLTAQYTPGAFGWDDSASIVPASMVPSYHGSSSYLLMTKYNDYAGLGGTGHNEIAILDPNATEIDQRTGATVMNEVITIAGPTPDPDFPGLPGAVREWCINSAVVDPFTDSVLANSEDGKLYRWDLTSNSFTQSVTLTHGIGEAYTPTLIGADGEVFAINDATLFALGEQSVPEPGAGTLAVAALAAGVLCVRAARPRRRSPFRRPPVE